jgi:hypothetical protein
MSFQLYVLLREYIHRNSLLHFAVIQALFQISQRFESAAHKTLSQVKQNSCNSRK